MLSIKTHLSIEDTEDTEDINDTELYYIQRTSDKFLHHFIYEFAHVIACIGIIIYISIILVYDL
jgi:hypothetical protein